MLNISEATKKTKTNSGIFLLKAVLYHNMRVTITYDHRLKRIGHPVRSAIHKLEIGGLVVGWVTTSEYPLLYVFVCSFCFIAIFCCRRSIS
jgi:hypothetical protein